MVEFETLLGVAAIALANIGAVAALRPKNRKIEKLLAAFKLRQDFEFENTLKDMLDEYIVKQSNAKKTT